MTDVFSAILYKDCQECKLVKKPPQFLDEALRAAAVYDYLYGSISWWDFLYYLTAQRQKRDIASLRAVGYSKVPDLPEKILLEIDAQLRPSDYFYKGKKVDLCRRLCLKYKSEIESCMNEERDVANRFIRKNVATLF